MVDIIYHACTTKFDGTSNRLINVSHIKYEDAQIGVQSLWDTGATISCISMSVVSKLSLVACGKRNIQTPSGNKIVNTYLLDIILPNNVKIQDVEVCDSDIGNQGIDLLIGMDIISKGDFAVSNYNGKTVFSFRFPSKQVTDYVQQINVDNLCGKKHGKGKRKRK